MRLICRLRLNGGLIYDILVVEQVSKGYNIISKACYCDGEEV